MESNLTLGRTLITHSAHGALSEPDVLEGLRRHRSGDHGDNPRGQLIEEEVFASLLSADHCSWDPTDAHSSRVYSRYLARNGEAFYVYTEPDCSQTLVLLEKELWYHLELTWVSDMPLSCLEIAVPEPD
jgi:hypothetical protein